MRLYTSSAAIDAPAATAWPILSEVAAWPEWLPTVSHVEALDGLVLRLGARFVVHQPSLRPATWTVTKLVDGESFTWEARVPGLVMVAEHILEARSSTRSAIELRFTFDGFLGGILGRLYGSITQSYLEREAAALKARSEKTS